MSTVSGQPMFQEPPQDVIEAARKVRQWAEEQGYKEWSIYGLQPVGSQSVTRLALNALWMLSSPRYTNAAQLQNIAQMNAETVEREMDPNYE